MDMKDYISLVDLATRFSKAKGMEKSEYQWMRKAPGRGSSKNEKVGNSLAVRKAIKQFNTANPNPIEVYQAKGYDGTPRKVMIIKKEDIIRLKGFILRGGGKGKRGRRGKETSFKIVSKVDI